MHSLLGRTSGSLVRTFKSYRLLILPLSVGVALVPVGCKSDSSEPAGSSGEASAGDAGAPNETGGDSEAGSSGKPSADIGGALNAGGKPGVDGGEGGEAGESGEGGAMGGTAGLSAAGGSGPSGGGQGGSAGGASCVAGTGSPGTGAVPVKVEGEGIWAAWQDGDGPWFPLAKSSDNFTFRPTGTRYAVAVVCGTDSYASGEVIYGTTAQTTIGACPGIGEAPCDPAFQGTVKGTLSNVGTSQWLVTNDNELGHAITPVSGSVSYSVDLDYTNNLLFGIAAASGQALTRIAVLRNAVTENTQSPATMNVDLNTAGKATTLKNIVVSGLAAGDTQTHQATWNLATQNCGNNSLLVSTNAASATDTYAALDSSLVQAGDSYDISVRATKGGDSKNGANVSAHFSTAKDVVLPVVFANVNGSLVAVVPYPRAQASFPPYANATGYSLRTSCPTGITWSLTASPAWLGTCSDCKLSMPDLSAVNCWNDKWACGSASTLSASFGEQARSGSGDSTLSWSASRSILPATP